MLPQLTWYIPRYDMPQIDNVADCLAWLKSQGVGSDYLSGVAPYTFHNHQRVIIDPVRAAHIPPSVLLSPLVVAHDNYIVDGNHRWWLALQRGFPVNVWRVTEPFGDALVTLSRYPNVRHERGEK